MAEICNGVLVHKIKNNIGYFFYICDSSSNVMIASPSITTYKYCPICGKLMPVLVLANAMCVESYIEIIETLLYRDIVYHVNTAKYPDNMVNITIGAPK